MTPSVNQAPWRSPDGEVFLMSRPRDDWTVRGKANVFAEGAASTSTPLGPAAQADWDHLAAAIRVAGGVIVEVTNPDPLLTGLPYTAEAGVLGRDADGPVFLLPRLTPPHRQREPEVIAARCAALGLRTRRVQARHEGQGDVIDVGARGNPRFVCTHGEGPYARSEAAAFAEVAPLLPGPARALAFRADPWFHGNTFLGAFRANDDSGRVALLVCRDAFVDAVDVDSVVEFASAGDAIVDVVFIDKDQSLTYPTNALQVGETVLAPRGVPDVVVDAWQRLGLAVRFLDLPTLFGRGGGAAVCLTNRLWPVDP